VAHDAQLLEIGAHDLAASDALLGDQASPLQVAMCCWTAAKLIG
jgi:hypothetical protein